jgi:hypothetical protein
VRTERCGKHLDLKEEAIGSWKKLHNEELHDRDGKDM